jgi:SOS-response transcriptional repressor LexA
MLPLTKRQREILDYLNEFIQQHGYAPSLEEIGRRSSVFRRSPRCTST